jgi:hypothetical protein
MRKTLFLQKRGWLQPPGGWGRRIRSRAPCADDVFMPNRRSPGFPPRPHTENTPSRAPNETHVEARDPESTSPRATYTPPGTGSAGGALSTGKDENTRATSRRFSREFSGLSDARTRANLDPRRRAAFTARTYRGLDRGTHGTIVLGWLDLSTRRERASASLVCFARSAARARAEHLTQALLDD